MSAYSFIATNYEIPEVYNSKKRTITVKDAIELGIKPHELVPWEKMNPNDTVIIFEEEDDMGELSITKGTEFEKNVRWYTEKSFIYSVDFTYSEARVQQLFSYLKENINEGQQLELWSIWLDDRKIIEPIICDYKEADIKYLKQMYNWRDKKHTYYCGLIIKK